MGSANIKKVIEILDQLLKDTSVPRNIRKGAENMKSALLNEKEDIRTRAGSALYILEELTNDRNLPMHARTMLWNIASELEKL